jgi:hypothetical protein
MVVSIHTCSQVTMLAPPPSGFAPRRVKALAFSPAAIHGYGMAHLGVLPASAVATGKR